jgi:hypothetical protein
VLKNTNLCLESLWSHSGQSIFPNYRRSFPSNILSRSPIILATVLTKIVLQAPKNCHVPLLAIIVQNLHAKFSPIIFKLIFADLSSIFTPTLGRVCQDFFFYNKFSRRFLCLNYTTCSPTICWHNSTFRATRNQKFRRSFAPFVGY